MTELRQWAAQWGDIASIFGVLLAIVGFALTLVGVWRSKSAADQAKQAAEDARDSIARYNAIVDLTAAMAIMEEIKRLQRNAAWAVLPDRYAELQRRLTAIRSAHVSLSEGQRQTLTAAIGAFAELERRVDQAVFAKTVPSNPAKLNYLVSGQIDEVHVVLLSLQPTSRQA